MIKSKILNNRTPHVLIVGPGKYFGLTLCATLLDNGWLVTVISPSGCGNLSALDKNANFNRLSIDVLDTKSVDRLFEEFGQSNGLDGVIYNAKWGTNGGILNSDPLVISSAVSHTIEGAVRLMQSFHNLRLTQKESTSQKPFFLLTGGGYGKRAHRDKFALSLSKANIHLLQRDAMITLKNVGISLKTLIIDGWVRNNSTISPNRVALAFMELINAEQQSVALINQNGITFQTTLFD